MYHTKLLETVRSLDARERTRWREYVHAGLFNRHEGLRRLCDYILEVSPDLEQEALQKKRAFEHLFGAGAAYNELKMNNLISDLYFLLLDFLAFLRFETDRLVRLGHIADELLARNLDKQAAGALERYRKELERRPDRTAGWLRHERHWWEAAEVLHSRQARRSAGEHLRRQADALDLSFALDKLRMTVVMLSRNALAVVQADDRPRWLNELRQWCHADDLFRQYPPVQVYLAALDLVEKPENRHFEALREVLDQHDLLFPPDEQTALYQLALNYCIRRINDGFSEAYSDALTLYRTMLDRGLLLRQGRLSQWTYKNITAAGLRSGAFAWTEDFLYRYRDTLHPSERENAFAYNLAELHFEKQDFAGALRALQNVEFTDFTYQLGAKTLQLKCFYALGEWEALTALLDSTRQLLRRNRSLSNFGKTTNLNFLRLLRQIKYWKQNQSFHPSRRWQAERQQLQDEIERTKPLAQKDWLLKCI